MISELSMREIKKFSRINSIPENFKDLNLTKQKEYFLERLKDQNWKKTIKRLDYNTWLFYKKIFKCSLVVKEKEYFITIDDIEILIRIQDYFFIKFMKEITKKKYTLIKELWFDEDNFINNDLILIEKPESTHMGNKRYRVDYKFYISGNNYFCLEFFEGAHDIIDDPEHKIESNRIFSILHNSDDRYNKTLFFGIYWENYLNNQKYFKSFVNKIYECIINYKDIDNEKVWCANAINKYINNDFLSISIYESWKEQDIANISIDELNSTINFKNKSSKTKHYDEFIDKIDRYILESNPNIDDNILDDIEDSDDEDESIETIKQCIVYKENYYKNNMLTFAGLYTYLYIKEEYLIDIREHMKLINFPECIANGFIAGLIEQRDNLLHLDNNRIIGLDGKL